MKNNEIICYCSNVSREQIVSAIQNGAKSMDDIRNMTSACTIANCTVMNPKKRCCSSDIMKILRKDLP